MFDAYGRNIHYLRLSVTDLCNLRCRYCMPDGVPKLAHEDILTYEEFLRLAALFAQCGIDTVRITGGEPLVRRGVEQLTAGLKAIPGIRRVALTTNGVLLERYLDDLAEAGIDGINISLDTLDRDLYQRITGTDALGTVMEAVRRACAMPVSVKINAVSIDFSQMDKEQREAGQDGWRQMVELAREYPVDVRFIEMMPIGYGKNFKTINHQELLEEMMRAYPDMEEDDRVHGFGPAVYYRIPGFKGSIGLISAIHGKFCSDCNRVRLTSKGYLKPCLCYEDGVDLRRILRKGQERPEEEGHYRWPYAGCPSDEGLQRELRKAMEQAVLCKPAAHCFERPGQITEAHNMIAIGG